MSPLHVEQPFLQVLLLLGCAVAIVLAFQRMRVPSSLAYLLVGLILGPHTAGPVVQAEPIQAIAEFGIVFLLFTIGLSFSLPQIHALRHLVLGLGTAQVGLTTLFVGLLAWAVGTPPLAAFVIGAVFAQSSTTIISKQLADQGEEHTRHARLGVAMSVFQDVTAVPFVIVIPVLATAGAAELGISLAWAMAKAVLAFVAVFVLGRRLLRPLFHRVAVQRSAELFTLTVLFVSLMAGAITQSLGLSMAFGAFLAGMVLGETEFRHQVEATVRPFRDVLLGLFFIGVGTLIDPRALAQVWHWGLLGAVVMMVVKGGLVAAIVRRTGIDMRTSWRTAAMLAVGGEFGFAVLALGLDARLMDAAMGQAVLASVLISMIAGPVLIRHNLALARALTPRALADAGEAAELSLPAEQAGRPQVLLAGYGRVGQSLGHLMEAEGIAYAALDLDADRVREARLAGEAVTYGDSTQLDVLEALGLQGARLLVITHDDTPAAVRTLQQVRLRYPELPVMVRTRDQSSVDELRAAGATEVVPETLEASLMIVSQALLQLGVPLSRVLRSVQAQRADHYRQLRGLFAGDVIESAGDGQADRLHAVPLPEGTGWEGRPLSELPLEGVAVTALVRQGKRRLQPPPGTVLQAGDSLVLFGPADALVRAEEDLLR